MNNKGFTLIELLATMAILGIISTVTIVSITSYYKKSEEKAVSAFEKNITDYVDSYISLYGSKEIYTSYNSGSIYKKCYKIIENSIETEKCNETKLSYTTIKFNKMYEKNITNNDVINPSTNVKCEEEDIKIYKDSDYVYCFLLEGACTNKINTCKNKYKDNNGEYIFNE